MKSLPLLRAKRALCEAKLHLLDLQIRMITEAEACRAEMCAAAPVRQPAPALPPIQFPSSPVPSAPEEPAVIVPEPAKSPEPEPISSEESEQVHASRTSEPPPLRPPAQITGARPRYDPNAEPMPVNPMRLSASEPPVCLPPKIIRTSKAAEGSPTPASSTPPTGWRRGRLGMPVVNAKTGEVFARSISAAAEKLGVAHPTVRAWIRDSKPTPNGIVLKLGGES